MNDYENKITTEAESSEDANSLLGFNYFLCSELAIAVMSSVLGCLVNDFLNEQARDTPDQEKLKNYPNVIKLCEKDFHAVHNGNVAAQKRMVAIHASAVRLDFMKEERDVR